MSGDAGASAAAAPVATPQVEVPLPSVVDPLLTELVQSIYQTPLSKESLLPVAIRCMEAAALVSTMSGSQKKQWVLSVLRQSIRNHPLVEAAEKVELLVAVDVLVSPAIDHLVSAAQGAYQFVTQAAQSKGWSCCGSSTAVSP